MGVKEEAGKRAGKDLTTLKSRHKDLIKLIPKRSGRIFAAESGIHEPRELQPLSQLGYHAALIGSAFLKGPGKIEDIVSKFTNAALMI
jgi:indole-3-glycerol phosphate synthase